jgi:ParB/RepB/Spo0J family partition protein
MSRSALPETGASPGENPVEQLALLPEQPLELRNDMLPIDVLQDEVVPDAPKQLVDSIRHFGLLQPLLIRQTNRMVHTEDGRELPGIEYALVDGRRRLSACRALAINLIPVLIAETDLAVADVATLATNALRTANPIAEYDAIDRLIRKGATVKDISGATGMSQQTIKARQRLFSLLPTLLDAFREGKITVSVAEAAAKLPKAIQQDLAVAQFATGKLTMTDIHDARTVRMQQAMGQMEQLDLTVKDADESQVIPDPPEFDQANRLSALADEIDPAQATVVRSIRWCAAILMDIATGQRKEIMGMPVIVDPTMPSMTFVDPTMPSMTFSFPDGSNVRVPHQYVMGQGVPSDATPNDAPVEQPGRVFTATKIEESEEEAYYDQEPEDMDTSDQEPYPAELADDERYPGMDKDFLEDVFR